MASYFAKRLDLAAGKKPSVAAVIAVCVIVTLSTSSIAISLMTYSYSGAAQHEVTKTQLKVLKRQADPFSRTTNIDDQITQLAVDINATHPKLDELTRSGTNMFWSLVLLSIGVDEIASELNRGSSGKPREYGKNL